jgi:hypothetical protein
MAHDLIPMKPPFYPNFVFSFCFFDASLSFVLYFSLFLLEIFMTYLTRFRGFAVFCAFLAIAYATLTAIGHFVIEMGLLPNDPSLLKEPPPIIGLFSILFVAALVAGIHVATELGEDLWKRLKTLFSKPDPTVA